MPLLPSPFPGMNPYLEDPQLWSAVHNRLIVAIADDLVDYLNEKYRVEIEKRTYFSTDDESLFVGIPDVSVVTGRTVEATPSTATLVPVVEPTKVTIPIAEEVNERYLEIREVATGKVVTVIEILSPKNKRPGEGREAYKGDAERVKRARWAMDVRGLMQMSRPHCECEPGLGISVRRRCMNRPCKSYARSAPV